MNFLNKSFDVKFIICFILYNFQFLTHNKLKIKPRTTCTYRSLGIGTSMKIFIDTIALNVVRLVFRFLQSSTTRKKRFMVELGRVIDNTPTVTSLEVN